MLLNEWIDDQYGQSSDKYRCSLHRYGRDILLGVTPEHVLHLTTDNYVHEIQLHGPQVRFVDLIVLIMTVGLAAAVMHIAVRSISTGFKHAQRNAEALRASNVELQASRDALVQQTSELERRARYLEATVSVSRDVSTVQEPQMLLTRVVRLISEQFGC